MRHTYDYIHDTQVSNTILIGKIKQLSNEVDNIKNTPNINKNEAWLKYMANTIRQTISVIDGMIDVDPPCRYEDVDKILQNILALYKVDLYIIANNLTNYEAPRIIANMKRIRNRNKNLYDINEKLQIIDEIKITAEIVHHNSEKDVHYYINRERVRKRILIQLEQSVYEIRQIYYNPSIYTVKNWSDIVRDTSLDILRSIRCMNVIEPSSKFIESDRLFKQSIDHISIVPSKLINEIANQKPEDISNIIKEIDIGIAMIEKSNKYLILNK